MDLGHLIEMKAVNQISQSHLSQWLRPKGDRRLAWESLTNLPLTKSGKETTRKPTTRLLREEERCTVRTSDSRTRLLAKDKESKGRTTTWPLDKGEKEVPGPITTKSHKSLSKNLTLSFRERECQMMQLKVDTMILQLQRKLKIYTKQDRSLEESLQLRICSLLKQLQMAKK